MNSAKNKLADGNDRALSATIGGVKFDDLTALLDGIQFRKTEDRGILLGRIYAHINQQVAVARITADVENDKRIKRLNRTIEGLQIALANESQRHIADLIELHGGPLHMGKEEF